jgi:hypothetical protein
MYLRVTERRNRDGSTVAYYALAENVWNAQTKRSEAQVIHTFGRADQLDKAALQRLVASIQRVIDAAGAIATRDKASRPEIEIDAVFELGIVLAARTLAGSRPRRGNPRLHRRRRTERAARDGAVRHGGAAPR